MKLKIISWNWKKEKLNPLISQYLGFLNPLECLGVILTLFEQYCVPTMFKVCSWSSAISIENTVIPEVKE
jgi:hypothetical protein